MATCYCAHDETTSSTEATSGALDDDSSAPSGQRGLEARGCPFGPDFRQQKNRPVSDDTTSAELAISQFRGLVRSFFRASMASKRNLRGWVVDDMAVGRRLTERVECILESAVSSTKPSRLDDAIDILDHPKVDLTTYFRDVRGSLEREGDDAIYVLLRAAGRRSDNAARFVLPWALKSDRTCVREAAVEALADIGTEAAASVLRRISESDASSSVREAAKEALDEITEG